MMSDPTAPVAVICEAISATEAASIVAAAGGEAAIGSAPRCVRYPYHWFDASGSAPGIFGRRPLALSCLVDARTGLANTADRFVVEQRNPGSTVLTVSVDEDPAQVAARRYLAHSLRRQLRTIADFRVSLDYRGLVYKTFWLVDGAGDGILVDSGSGAFHALRAA